MLKLYETMNKEVLKMAFLADENKIRLLTWKRDIDNTTVYTDGYIAYLIPDRYNRIKLPEQYTREQTINFKTENLQLEPCNEINTDGKIQWYKTSFEKIGINVKALKNFPDCTVFSTTESRGMFFIYYNDMFVGVIMGTRIKA